MPVLPDCGVSVNSKKKSNPSELRAEANRKTSLNLCTPQDECHLYSEETPGELRGMALGVANGKSIAKNRMKKKAWMRVAGCGTGKLWGL